MRILRTVLLVVLAPVGIGQDNAVDTVLVRMNRFAATYNDFGKAWNLGKFDTALARKLSREWREVENSGEWPR